MFQIAGSCTFDVWLWMIRDNSKRKVFHDVSFHTRCCKCDDCKYQSQIPSDQLWGLNRF
jgi:hypothetical protein